MSTLTYSNKGTATAEGNLPRTLTTGNVVVAAGDLIIAHAIDSNYTSTFGAISDSAGNTFVSLTQTSFSRSYYCLVADHASATDVFTVQCTGSGYVFPRLIVTVFTVDGYTFTFIDGGHTSDNSTAIDTADATSTETDSLWVCGVGVAGVHIYSNQTIAGSAATVVTGSDGRIDMFYRVLSAPTTDDAQSTLETAILWEATLMLFDAAASGGGDLTFTPHVSKRMIFT